MVKDAVVEDDRCSEAAFIIEGTTHPGVGPLGKWSGGVVRPTGHVDIKWASLTRLSDVAKNHAGICEGEWIAGGQAYIELDREALIHASLNNPVLILGNVNRVVRDVTHDSNSSFPAIISRGSP